MKKRFVSVTGLGYVGLPVATAFAAAGYDVVGFDVDERRIAELREGVDRTGEVDESALHSARLRLTTESADLRKANFHIVTVPTPITAAKLPDLTPLLSATRTIAGILKHGDIVVYESTVYPGATEEDCVPLLESLSGLTFNRDFFVGYSPERINPGDKVHRLETIVKVVSGSTQEALDAIAQAYNDVVPAGIHRAPSIKVAEAAKVIENTQRDLNIALMNELALIFDRLGIRTTDVLAAAGTKWNFLRFSPGLVGGHCIGVDPYYLTAKAESVGYRPEVILAGRRTNDQMGALVAQRLIKDLVRIGRVQGAKVGVLGLTFKENVPDLRNSRVPDIVRELAEFGICPLIHDSFADAREAQHEFDVELTDIGMLVDLDAIVLAVPHEEYVTRGWTDIAARIRHGGVLYDLKSCLNPDGRREDISYWSL